MCTIISATNSQVLKRSPLEIGLVSFTDTTSHFKFFTTTSRPLLNNETLKSKSDVSNPEHLIIHAHVKHEWIPGHVHNHAFIPAHSHSVIIPAPIILSKAVESVLVQPTAQKLVFDGIPYRHHYGGFGAGVDSGGPGAGHGYHVVF